jgi:hypothetical protein
MSDRVLDKEVSSPGLSFVNKIKIAPPFLGYQYVDPAISQTDEIKLVEFFHAQDFRDNNRIKGGIFYKIVDGDDADIIAEKVYKDKKFSYLVNRITFPIGTSTDLPYLNLDNPSQSNLSIDKLMKTAENEKEIITLLKRYYLPEHEVLQLIRIVYDAAQKALLVDRKLL